MQNFRILFNKCDFQKKNEMRNTQYTEQRIEWDTLYLIF